MKKIICFLFIVAGISFANSAYSQSTKDTMQNKNGKKQVPAKPNDQKTNAGKKPSGSGGITIDEGGIPKAKSPKGNATTVPAGDNGKPKSSDKSQQQTSERKDDYSSAPAPIAIDEGGAPKIKTKPTSTISNPSTTTSSDSIKVAPAAGVEKPH